MISFSTPRCPYSGNLLRIKTPGTVVILHLPTSSLLAEGGIRIPRILRLHKTCAQAFSWNIQTFLLELFCRVDVLFGRDDEGLTPLKTNMDTQNNPKIAIFERRQIQKKHIIFGIYLRFRVAMYLQSRDNWVYWWCTEPLIAWIFLKISPLDQQKKAKKNPSLKLNFFPFNSLVVGLVWPHPIGVT